MVEVRLLAADSVKRSWLGIRHFSGPLRRHRDIVFVESQNSSPPSPIRSRGYCLRFQAVNEAEMSGARCMPGIGPRTQTAGTWVVDRGGCKLCVDKMADSMVYLGRDRI